MIEPRICRCEGFLEEVCPCSECDTVTSLFQMITLLEEAMERVVDVDETMSFIESLSQPDLAAAAADPQTPQLLPLPHSLKRKHPASIDVGEVAKTIKLHQHRDLDTSEESEDDEAADDEKKDAFSPAAVLKARSRRQQFKRSKVCGRVAPSDFGSSEMASQCVNSSFQSNRTNYSMPVASTSSPQKCGSQQQSRRASLPHNLKIPAITITPSSPCPDPNHPDYPEFFEDKLYLETKRKSSTSSSGGESKASVESKDNVAVELKEDESSLEICFETVARSPQQLQQQPLITDVVDLVSSDTEMDSTLEFEDLLEQAEDGKEKENCLNFARGNARRRRDN